MKKFILFFLVICLCFSFSACGIIGDIIGGDRDNEINSANSGLLGALSGIGKNDKEEKYEDLIEMLEDEDYESALLYIIALSQGGEIDGEDFGEVIVTLPVAEEAPEGYPYEVELTYDNIVYGLESYLEYGYFSYYDNVDGMVYENVEAFEHAVSFLETYSDYEAAKEFLSRITCVEDVLLRIDEVSYDYLGNVSEYEGVEEYKYDEFGRIVLAEYDTSNIEEMRYDSWYDTFGYEYDADGNVVSTKIYTYEGGDVDALITPYYENGVLVSEDVRCADGRTFTVIYIYDDLGRLQYWVREEENCITSGTYTYNDMGLVEDELVICSYYDSWSGEYVLDDAFLKSYVYDEKGNPVKMVYNKQEDYDNYNAYYWRTSTDNYDFIYDDNGRMIAMVIIYGEDVYGYDGSTALPNKINSEYNFVYGNYYFFE